MKKATVTYTAPQGEAKSLDIAGTTLLTGKADTVICEDAMMKKLEAASKKGGLLYVDNVTDYTPPPPKAEPPPHDDKHKGKAA